jgi:hypothetical protein
MSYYDFNTAEDQSNFDVIPKGTIAKVHLRIKAGGYNDESQGWTGGYATRSESSNAVYLSCEFTVLEGEYARRKIWSLIGLYSEKNDNRWGQMGRSFIRGLLNSAKGISGKDNSEAAQEARKIGSFAELDGLEFVAKIDITEDQDGIPKNVIKAAINPEHVDYDSVMGVKNANLPGWA